jgi:hypothetical protein
MMTKSHLLAFALVALLAGCGDPQPVANTPQPSIVTHDNAIIVPEAQPEANAANAAEAARPALNLAPDGLSLVLDSGAARHIAFGMPREPATRMVAAALGEPVEQGDNQECGAGALAFATFPGGLGLYFQDGKFVGWDLDARDGGRFATAAGVGIGTSRSQLESANAITVEDTSLGIEFRSGGMSGLLSARDPSGEVTNLWAGTTCIAR